MKNQKTTKICAFILILLATLAFSSGCLGGQESTKSTIPEIVVTTATKTPAGKPETLLDRTIDLKGGQYYVHCWEFKTDHQINITINVLSGPAVDFYVIDEKNLENFENGKEFKYYVKPSGQQIRELHTKWEAPDGNICFIVSNIKNRETATVKIKITAVAEVIVLGS